MRKLKNRVTNKIFKNTLSVGIDYHAGGFFINKRVEYLIFINDTAFFYQRQEGTHPKDNDIEKLIKEVKTSGKKRKYKICQSDILDNLLILENKDESIKCMPSIFIEQIVDDTLLEMVIDRPEKKEIYSFVGNIVT